MINLEEQIILVTGASRGIGRSIAQTLGNAGGTIIGTATTDAGAQAISDYFAASNILGKGMKLNVTDTSSIDNLIKSVSDEFGGITVLVNNAGITRDNLMLRMKEEEWEAIITTNLTSVFRLSKACLKGMVRARKGRIISISSVVGSTGNAGQANYAAAKAGVVGFSKSLAQEVGSRGITVNVVAPGFIDTDMTKELPEEQRKKLQENIPLRKLGQPEDIANAVLFLASNMGSYITGETIHVNGGMYMS